MPWGSQKGQNASGSTGEPRAERCSPGGDGGAGEGRGVVCDPGAQWDDSPEGAGHGEEERAVAGVVHEGGDEDRKASGGDEREENHGEAAVSVTIGEDSRDDRDYTLEVRN